MPEANPFINEHAMKELAKRRPFYAVVNSVSGAYVDITPQGQQQSIGLCPASATVILSVLPGDIVACIPIGPTPFAFAIKAV